MHRVFVALVASSLLAAFTLPSRAAQSGAAAKAEGPMMFKQYCATCHGLSGKGDGPTAPSLKKMPADLTLLQQKGQPFPARHVVHEITGEPGTAAAHGSREMPVWGRAFNNTEGTPPPTVAINALVNYLKTIQVNQ